ncbi:glycosyltransferase [Pontibacter sp. E15-1]|uniref:glycosyltransferase n=1 Tax=Pontibacter sp. E15-1 TaxID=2919918 RepID=UPI001F4F7768|nr:glycosyltransferase [Pontibacter sp. E15-1]MCJ8163622.1 glycosyltransferase [Pontibacter sp. E15-1]
MNQTLKASDTAARQQQAASAAGSTPAKDLLQNRDFIIVGQQPWDTSIGSNCKNIAAELSKHNRVLYVNAPLDRITAVRDRHDKGTKKRLQVIRGKQQGMEKVAPNLWVLYPDCMLESINWLPRSPLYTFFNRKNNGRFAASIKEAARMLGFSDFILFNDNDILRSFYLKELLQPALSVYYSRDNMQAVAYWKKHGARHEPALMAKSDLCLANSSYLAACCKRYNPNSFYVGQGCDLDITSSASDIEIPADVQMLKSPLIGYVGALVDLRLDIGLLQYISEQRQDWNLVLVGPEDEAFRASALHHQPNVHFLGQKETAQLPAYIHQFDVCLNPQRVNLMTIGNYPRKIDEYLALGKPVVATRTEAMDIFADHTYLATSKEDFVRLIDKALAEDSPARQLARRQLAATHTWENSVAEIYKAILSCSPKEPAQYKNEPAEA